MANKKLQILRNAEAYASREAALTALKAKLATLADGEMALARYNDADGNVVTLVGIASTLSVSGSNTVNYTILDRDQIPADVQEALDTINGKLTVIQGDDTVDGSIKKALADAKSYADGLIAALDVTDTAVAHSFVTSVSETDGKISVSRGAVTSNNKTVTLSNGTDGGINLDVNIDGSTIVKNDNGVLSVASSALVQYEGENAINVSDVDTDNNKTISLKINTNDTILSQNTDGLKATVSISKLATASEGYAASYQLVDKNGDSLGTTIDIPKDMVVSAGEVKVVETADTPYTGAAVGDKYIDLTIANADNSHIYVPVKDLVDIYTSGNGVTVADDNTISVKIDGTSETFLTVGTDGVKLSGVADAIKTAVGNLDVDSVGTSGSYLVTISETDGKISATAQAFDTTLSSTSTNDNAPTSKAVYEAIAAAGTSATTALEAEKTARAAADDTIEAAVGLSADGGHITTTGNYTKNATTVVGEIAALDTQVKANADAIDALKADTSYVKNVTVNNVNATVANNKATVTIDGADIKLDGYSIATANAAVAATDTVNTAVGKLEFKVDAVAAAARTVAAGNGISVSANDTVDTITAVAVTDDPIIEVTANGIGTKEDAVFDCGTY